MEMGEETHAPDAKDPGRVRGLVSQIQGFTFLQFSVFGMKHVIFETERCKLSGEKNGGGGGYWGLNFCTLGKCSTTEIYPQPSLGKKKSYHLFLKHPLSLSF